MNKGFPVCAVHPHRNQLGVLLWAGFRRSMLPSECRHGAIRVLYMLHSVQLYAKFVALAGNVFCPNFALVAQHNSLCNG